jgi:hypothetical protein
MLNFTSGSVISEFVRSTVPEFLFHYTSSDGLVSIIESNKLRTTKINYLSDKSESILAFNLVQDEIKKQKEGIDKTRSNEDLDNVSLFVDPYPGGNICVASFTELGDQLSQWRGYCEIGKGYSIGFNGAKLIQQVRNQKEYFLMPCIYDEKLQQKMAKEIVDSNPLKPAYPVYEGYNYGVPFLKWGFFDAVQFLSAIMKSECFKEEKEWRLISSPLSYTDAHFRSGNYSLIPYWEFKLDLSNTLSNIIIGPTPEPDLSKAAIFGLLIKNKLLRGRYDNIIQSKIPYRRI